jgi:hypothetical protein
MLLRSSTVFLQPRKIEISTVRKGSPKLDLRRHIWRFNTMGYEDIKNYVHSKCGQLGQETAGAEERTAWHL